MSTPETSPLQTPVDSTARRVRMLAGLAALIVVCGGGFVAYHELRGRWYESTEDAYANGNVVPVVPQTSGSVVAIYADENRLVQKGQTLVELDGADARIALEQAEASLAKTVRQVRGLYSNVGNLTAELGNRRTAVERARADVERRRNLVATGAIPAEELAHANETLAQAQSALAAAQEQLASGQAMTDNTAVLTHPDVKVAAALVRKAYLDMVRSKVQAPLTGYVTQRGVQVGQRVQPSSSLMAIVPLDQVWVEANFKETQLPKMRIGQNVELISDVYGDDVLFHGRIAGLGMGTGSAFSILPAQNATGNWIKIVQRVPVRIALSRSELAAHPLKIGLSMRVEVDLHDQHGPMLSTAPSVKPLFATDVFVHQMDEADKLIANVIQANLASHAAPRVAPTKTEVQKH
jgi:membrane fusion protein, multidrug efflux system